jgi:hypothetical protein
MDSPYLRKQIIGGRIADSDQVSISRVPFKNGSVLHTLSAWGDFAGIRNIPADLIAIDEAQDIQAEAIPVIEETLSHSSIRRMCIVGTASIAGSEFDKLWQNSDMKEWSQEAQTWIPRKPENRFYSGYHISQEMAPWINRLRPEDPDSIQAKKLRYSERRYLNEVQGLFYRGLGKPLLPEDIRRCYNRDLSLFEKLDPPYQSFAGIDWGGGVNAFTVIWIMTLDDRDRWRLIYVRKFSRDDPLKQVEIIGNMFDIFRVRRCVADIGYGSVQVEELQKKFEDCVIGCQYVRDPEIPLRKMAKEEFGKRIASLMVQADRSYFIEKAIHIIKWKASNGNYVPKLVIPYAEPMEVEWLMDHFCCIEMEEQQTSSGRKYHRYVHPEGESDDALHAFVYALIAEADDRMTPELVIQTLFD